MQVSKNLQKGKLAKSYTANFTAISTAPSLRKCNFYNIEPELAVELRNTHNAKH